MEKQIYSLVLTGGPCGGKTTALCFLEEKLRDMGFTVILIHEGATELIASGLKPGKTISVKDFQELLFDHVINKEKMFRTAAQKTLGGDKVVLLHDRGRMDMLAYDDEVHFAQMLRTHNLSIPQIRDQHYDGIFHLHSLAHDKEDIYKELWRGNPARLEENPKDARDANDRTMNAWLGCPHLFIIDNSDNFESKVKRVWQSVCRVLGIPVPLEIERKFLIEPISPESIPISFQAIDIEQAYLPSPKHDQEVRIRRRGQQNSYVYYMTHKQLVETGVRQENEHHLSEEEYADLFSTRDKKFSVISKERFCFVWNDQYFELDRFHRPREGLHLLELELTEKNQKMEIPPFINVIQEVTADPAFSNRELARIA